MAAAKPAKKMGDKKVKGQGHTISTEMCWDCMSTGLYIFAVVIMARRPITVSDRTSGYHVGRGWVLCSFIQLICPSVRW